MAVNTCATASSCHGRCATKSHQVFQIRLTIRAALRLSLQDRNLPDQRPSHMVAPTRQGDILERFLQGISRRSMLRNTSDISSWHWHVKGSCHATIMTTRSRGISMPTPNRRQTACQGLRAVPFPAKIVQGTLPPGRRRLRRAIHASTGRTLTLAASEKRWTAGLL